MSKLAHSSEKHMEEIETNKLREEGYSEEEIMELKGRIFTDDMLDNIKEANLNDSDGIKRKEIINDLIIEVRMLRKRIAAMPQQSVEHRDVEAALYALNVERSAQMGEPFYREWWEQYKIERPEEFAEEMAQMKAAIAALPQQEEMGEEDLHQLAMDACRNADMSVDGPRTHFIRALQAKARIVKRDV